VAAVVVVGWSLKSRFLRAPPFRVACGGLRDCARLIRRVASRVACGGTEKRGTGGSVAAVDDTAGLWVVAGRAERREAFNRWHSTGWHSSGGRQESSSARHTRAQTVRRGRCSKRQQGRASNASKAARCSTLERAGRRADTLGCGGAVILPWREHTPARTDNSTPVMPTVWRALLGCTCPSLPSAPARIQYRLSAACVSPHTHALIASPTNTAARQPSKVDSPLRSLAALPPHLPPSFPPPSPDTSALPHLPCPPLPAHPPTHLLCPSLRCRGQARVRLRGVRQGGGRGGRGARDGRTAFRQRCVRACVCVLPCARWCVLTGMCALDSVCLRGLGHHVAKPSRGLF
jgi:hypothetical protein